MSSAVYTPSKQDRLMIEKCVRRARIGSDYWSPKDYALRKLLRNYDMEYKALKNSQNQSLDRFANTVFLPYSFKAMEVEIPIVVGMLTDHEPMFTAVQGHHGQDMTLVEGTGNLLQYQLRNRGLKEEVIEATQQVVKIGYQIFKLKWTYEKESHKKRFTKRFMGYPVGIEEVEEEYIAYDGPDFDRVPFYRFYIDPMTPPCKLQKARWLVEEDIMTFEEFLTDADNFNYDNVKWVEEALFADAAKGNKDKPAADGGTVQAELDERAMPGDEYAHDVKILYYLDREDIITVAKADDTDEGILLKRAPFHEEHANGKYPYFGIYNRFKVDSGVDIQSDTLDDYKPGGFYPDGDLKPIDGIQRALNTMIRQKLDFGSIANRIPLLVTEGAIVNPQDIAKGWVNNPLLWVKSDLPGVNPKNAIEQLKIYDAHGASFYNNFQLMEDSGVQALGLFESLTGEANPNIKTATAFMQATSNSMNRLKLKTHIMTLGFCEMLTEMSDMNARLISPDTIYYVTGNDQPQRISPEEIVRGVAFTIRRVPPYMKALIGEQIKEVIPMLEQYAPDITDVTRLIRLYLESFEWIESADEVISKDAQRMTFADLYMRRAQIQMMMQPQMIPPENNINQGDNGTISMDPGADAAREIEAQRSLGY